MTKNIEMKQLKSVQQASALWATHTTYARGYLPIQQFKVLPTWHTRQGLASTTSW